MRRGSWGPDPRPTSCVLAGSRGQHEFQTVGELTLKGPPPSGTSCSDRLVAVVEVYRAAVAPLRWPASRPSASSTRRWARSGSRWRRWKGAAEGEQQLGVLVTGEPGISQGTPSGEIPPDRARRATVLLGVAGGPPRPRRAPISRLPGAIRWVRARRGRDGPGGRRRSARRRARSDSSRTSPRWCPASPSPARGRPRDRAPSACSRRSSAGSWRPSPEQYLVVLVLGVICTGRASRHCVMVPPFTSRGPTGRCASSCWPPTVTSASTAGIARRDAGRPSSLARGRAHARWAGSDRDGVYDLLESAASNSRPGTQSLAQAVARRPTAARFSSARSCSTSWSPGPSCSATVGGRAIPPGGHGDPEGIREVIGRRLSRLPDEFNDILAMASVLGRDFGVALLSRLQGGGHEAVLGAGARRAGEARAAGPPSPRGRTFDHALVRVRSTSCRPAGCVIAGPARRSRRRAVPTRTWPICATSPRRLPWARWIRRSRPWTAGRVDPGARGPRLQGSGRPLRAGIGRPRPGRDADPAARCDH